MYCMMLLISYSNSCFCLIKSMSVLFFSIDTNSCMMVYCCCYLPENNGSFVRCGRLFIPLIQHTAIDPPLIFSGVFFLYYSSLIIRHAFSSLGFNQQRQSEQWIKKLHFLSHLSTVKSSQMNAIMI